MDRPRDIAIGQTDRNRADLLFPFLYLESPFTTDLRSWLEEKGRSISVIVPGQPWRMLKDLGRSTGQSDISYSLKLVRQFMIYTSKL